METLTAALEATLILVLEILSKEGLFGKQETQSGVSRA